MIASKRTTGYHPRLDRFWHYEKHYYENDEVALRWARWRLGDDMHVLMDLETDSEMVRCDDDETHVNYDDDDDSDAIHAVYANCLN